LSIAQSRLVPIAEVARPHGVQGELRLKLYNSDTPLIVQGKLVTLRAADGPGPSAADRSCRILKVRSVPGALLVLLSGIADRDAADAVRGARILVSRDEFPELDAGEFYACDLEGARVELLTGEIVGSVKSLEKYPTCEVLVVQTPDGKSIELPLVEDVVESIDAKAGLVRVHTSEGL